MMIRWFFAALTALTMTLTGCGASPDDVCNKQVELAEKAGMEVTGDLKEECINDETTKKDLKGMFKYKDYSSCIMESSTVEEAAKCK